MGVDNDRLREFSRREFLALSTGVDFRINLTKISSLF
jgi:hypothetical protein